MEYSLGFYASSFYEDVLLQLMMCYAYHYIIYQLSGY
jgi:hypothetical protein